MVRNIFSRLDPWLVSVVGILSILFVVCLNFTPYSTNDFWIQLTIGKLILAEKAIPSTALFTFTQAKDFPFVAHEWLPSVLFAVIYDAVGAEGLTYVKCGLALVLFWLVFFTSHLINRNKLISFFIASLCILTINYRTLLRPEIFAFLFLLLHLNFLTRFTLTGKFYWLLALLPVTVLWANSHGSFLLGLLLPLLFIGGMRLRKYYLPLFLIFLLVTISSLLNPYGIGLFRHSIELANSDFIRAAIFEWKPTFSAEFMATKSFKVYTLFLACLVFAVIVGRRQLTITNTFLLIVFGYLSIDAQRHIAPFSLISTLIFARCLKGRVESLGARWIFGGLLCGVLAGSSVFIYKYGNVVNRRMGNYSTTYFSPEALEFIKNKDISGNVINTYHLGGELIYHFFPKIKIAIDSRIDVYGERYWSEFQALRTDRDYLKKFLTQYNISHLILSHTDLQNLVAQNHKLFLDWRMAFVDSQVIIVAKDFHCLPTERCPTVREQLYLGDKS